MRTNEQPCGVIQPSRKLHTRTLTMHNILLSGLLLVATASAQQYTVTDLGVLPGSSSSNGIAINASGQVVGMCDSAIPGEICGFLWTNGTMTHLGTLGGTVGQPYDINASARVVGISLTGVGFDVDGFLWEGGVITELGSLGGNSTWAYGINDLGHVVGQSLTAADPVNHVAFRWTSGILTGLGTLPGGVGSTAHAVNGSGDLAGASGVAGGDMHVCLWTGGTITDLGTLGGTQGWANAINDDGVVVGQSKNASGSDHAFLWTAAGGMTDLGTLGGLYSSAVDINNDGQVVGSADLADGSSRAFIYDNEHGMRNLNDLISADANWVLSSADGINDAGQIVGTGKHNGETRAFLLTPQAPTVCCAPFGLLVVGFLVASCRLIGSRRRL